MYNIPSLTNTESEDKLKVLPLKLDSFTIQVNLINYEWGYFTSDAAVQHAARDGIVDLPVGRSVSPPNFQTELSQ